MLVVAASYAGTYADVTLKPRRFDRVSELALSAASRVLGDSNPDACGLYFATAEGNLSGTMEYLRRLKEKGPHFANPIDFPNLLFSAPAANVSMHLGIKGAALTFHQGEVSAYHALTAGCEAVESGRVTAAIVVEAEEDHTAALRIEQRQVVPGDVVIREIFLSGRTLPQQGVWGTIAACVGAMNALKQTVLVKVESDIHGAGAVLLERIK